MAGGGGSWRFCGEVVRLSLLLPRLARNWVTSPITGFSPVFPEIADYRKSLETES